MFKGSLATADGIIGGLDHGNSALPGAIDLEGDYLLPGLIELHTGHLESHIMPRPGVRWPTPLTALMAHDAQICGAGITTVFDSVFLGRHHPKSNRPVLIRDSLESIRRGRELNITRVDHLLHFRCELPDGQLMTYFEPYAHDPLLKLVSLNDHTPGQRQWRDLNAFAAYYQIQEYDSGRLMELVDGPG